MHVDIVLNEWGNARQVRVAVVRVGVLDERYQHLVEAVLAPLSNEWNNSYLFAGEPHAEADCPFYEHDILPMIVQKVDPPGSYVLPAPEGGVGDG